MKLFRFSIHSDVLNTKTLAEIRVSYVDLQNSKAKTFLAKKDEIPEETVCEMAKRLVSQEGQREVAAYMKSAGMNTPDGFHKGYRSMAEIEVSLDREDNVYTSVVINDTMRIKMSQLTPEALRGKLPNPFGLEEA